MLAVLARAASTDIGRELIQGLEPFADEGELQAHRRRYEEAARLIGEQPLVPGFDVPVGNLLRRLATDLPPLEGIDLVRLADLAKASSAAAQRVRQAEPPCHALASWAYDLPEVSPLLQRIQRTLDRRGEVREDASPRLAALRRQIRSVRDQLYRDLGEYVTTHRDELSEDTIPMRGGRLVLMQAAGSRGRGGLVHGRSATGKSFYFEPLEVVDSNNALQQSSEEEDAERRRILAELLGAARAALPELTAHGAFLGELDALQAAVRYASLCDGRLAELAPRHQLVLVAARHPLLDPSLAELRAEALGQAGHAGSVVPLDVSFDAGRRLLVVTGPNAGGKTVALKTIGLLALAAQCGLPIPAAVGSRVPWLGGGIVATVGDEQDLLTDRSTFSGRLLRLREAWETASPDSLVLLDELGSGTDPAEGAALSIALLEGLLDHQGLGVITTHLAELAAAALEKDGATCAAMEFDPHTGRPTFRLLPGPPGASEALALARRLGLPAAWLDRAEALLGSEHRDLRRLIAEVDRLRHELAEQRVRLEAEAADAETLRRRLDAEVRVLEQERRDVARRGRADLEAFRRETIDRLRGEVARLEESFAAGRRRGLTAEAVERLFAAPPTFGVEAVAEPAGPLVVGQAVRHLGLGWRGILQKLEGDRAEVTVNGKRVRSRAADLTTAMGDASPAAAHGAAGESVPSGGRRAGRSSAARARALLDELGAAATGGGRAGRGGGDIEETSSVAPEINLIGIRVEPALEELDAYLDRALLAALREVRVIHGHGTGRLRQAVREHLRGHPAVASVRSGEPNEGGNGATVVAFRGRGA